ncbi:sigma-70 family RNA polymerase sigma factor [Alkalicella caledoniensis]|uniref:Sigma-70 family RNA polymerase sigma factor n=1 Tax=Alkalicella caledoniensis TaxID=2731377 RepID=A0A7G9WBD5_ALKCA|nr:sigma factor [Alkalicella caledoniensis]QNO15997.1 sigma-70 family RNA polymerase sigma factor [Alkalicella caledoniensis]
MDKEKVIKSMDKGIYYFINMYNIETQDQEDVYQQCILKILTSLEQYKPSKGTTINQFLMPRIRGVVKEAVRQKNKGAIPKDEIYIIDSCEIEQELLAEEKYKSLEKAISKLSRMQKKL